MVTKGVYTADRAAALSGVPMSTIHYWARNEILVPTVSPEKVKLWSYADLMALRVIYWLRRRKTDASGNAIPATTMPAVRRALAELQRLELPVWEKSTGVALVANGAGHVYIATPDRLASPTTGQLADRDLLQPLSPFSTTEGLHGPDLVAPRPALRIVPGKLGGSPHVADTRIETRALAALREDGMTPERIRVLYPHLTEPQVAQALDLEDQLSRNLLRAAA